MKKWRCLVCDIIYDEAEGWPDDDIAPGTRWEDVPEDWVCPYCGVGKEDFEMVEITSTQMTSSVTNEPAKPVYDGDPIVIIGAGMAAYNLAKEFRKLDSTTPLKIISRDDASLYYKPSLSNSLTERKTPDELVMSLPIDADLVPFAHVSSIDRDAKLVTVSDENIHYSQLVFATGADVIRAPFAGDAVDLVHSVNDLLDYRKFRADLVGKSRVLIIGAGLIGCEFANDLLNRGIQVDIVDTLGQCMPTLMPAQAASVLEKALTDLGCRFYFDSKVQAINKKGDQIEVSLSSGKQLETDLVISAIGLKPRVDLALRAGLATGRGIIVDKYLQTTDPDIYALGDCAEIEGQVMMYVEPLLLSAKALAQTLSANRTAVQFDAMPVVVKTPACPVVVAAPVSAVHGQWEIEADNSNVRALFKNAEGENLGFVLTGDCTQQRKALQQTLPAVLAG
jgi:rubredoxin---NAD+ reductase